MADVISGLPSLEQEFEYYLAHQDEILEKYNGKVITIKGNEILAVYDDDLKAVTEVQRRGELGTVLIQRVTPGESAYTYTFNSRVGFP